MQCTTSSRRTTPWNENEIEIETETEWIGVLHVGCTDSRVCMLNNKNISVLRAWRENTTNSKKEHRALEDDQQINNKAKQI